MTTFDTRTTAADRVPWITQALEGSLRRLRTDQIDVYELGALDPGTDIDESLDALTDLMRAGKIRSFGTSKMPPSQIVEGRTVAERRGHGVFRTEELPYSILTRSPVAGSRGGTGKDRT